MPKPSNAVRSYHVATTMTDRQAARVRSGNLESQPSDYQQPTVEGRRLGVARRALEDRRVARELGIDQD